MKLLQKIRTKSNSGTKSKSLIIVACIITALIFFFSYMYLNGGVINERKTFTIGFDSPSEGTIFNEGQEITFSGHVIGGVIDRVIIWDERFNVGIECGHTVSLWQQNVGVDKFSVGTHVVCVRALCTDGTWSPVATRTIEVKTSTSSITALPLRLSSQMPQPLGIFFRPIEDIVDGIVVTIEGGTSSDDLNGDNIPDQFQQSPTGPSHNPMNIPMTTLIITILIFSALIIGIIMIQRTLSPFLSKREKRIETLQSKPDWRKWRLEQHQIKEKGTQKKLNEARDRTRKQDEEIRRLSKEKGVVINIQKAKTKKDLEDAHTKK